MISGNKTARPFLKWAGGKSKLSDEIFSLIPFEKEKKFMFVEPFVGSGAVLFRVLAHFPNITGAVINDINSDLINGYIAIRDSVEEIIDILTQFESYYNSPDTNSDLRKEFYYSKRDLFNQRESDNITRAAIFIFLNRTCFNGLYRVNKKNGFNVPIGDYTNPQICNAENLREVSNQLQKVTILNGDFYDTLHYAGADSFYYNDPPYKPLSKSSNFTSYSKENFDDREQIRLKNFCDELSKRGAVWALSNSDVKGNDPENNFFDDLFKDYKIKRVLARRNINSKASRRGKISELMISNQ